MHAFISQKANKYKVKAILNDKLLINAMKGTKQIQ